MKKNYLILAAAAASIGLASCSSDSVSLQENKQPSQQAQLEKGAVGFDVYTQRSNTRAGWAGSLTTAALKESSANLDYSKSEGFGVFGYYTDNNDYDQRSTPNFFYNQQVTWNTTDGQWKYEPVKYWPNEYGDAATSDDQDKVTYFAYAPYVKVVPTSGKLEGAAADKSLEQWGIVGLSRNNSLGDPMVKYIASFKPKKSVDLCWGVIDYGANPGATNSDKTVWATTQNSNTQTFENGLPWLNVYRPAQTDQRVKFNFKHALAQMKVNIDADVDVYSHGGDDVAKKTRVWVREVRFKGFALKGTLNLNNPDAYKPYWLDFNGQNELVSETVVVYDQRKDGKEGQAGAFASGEKLGGLNPAIVQDGIYAKKNADKTVYDDTEMIVQGVNENGEATTSDANYQRPGVTSATVALFNENTEVGHLNENIASASAGVFHVIPAADEDVEVEIVYDIETVDGNLAQNLSDGTTKGSSIENRISKRIQFGNASKLEAGHSYTINLHLGLNSVKFDAAVTDWVEEPAQDVELPANTPVFAHNSASNNASVRYDAADYTFAINGLNGGSTITSIFDDWKANSATGAVATTPFATWALTDAAKPANAGGVAIEKITTAINPTTSKRSVLGTWTSGADAQKTKITFIQEAHPLELHVGTDNSVTYIADLKTITLERSTDITPGYGWMCAGYDKDCAAVTPTTTPTDNPNNCGIKVWRNGTPLTWMAAGSPLAGNEFSFADDSADITFGDALQKGDIIKIELKTGDAPTEVITVKVKE